MLDEAEGLVDAAVYPRMLVPNQIRDYMEEPYRTLLYNSPNRFFHPTPTGISPYGEWLDASRPGGETVHTRHGEHPAREPGSLPAATTRYLSENGVTQAVLNPMLRGLIPAADQGTAICAAYNDWLADTWLRESADGLTYRGTIRVNPMDPDGAVAEIERWADHPRMVQVGIPVESHHPYGQRYYLPIWEAAVGHGFPVVIKADGGVGVEFSSTMTGLPRTHIEFSTLQRDRFFFHLVSFIAEGVFERFPALKIVSADGGFDLVTPGMWRMDMDWPITRTEVPWVKRLPTEYLQTNVRFIVNRVEGPPDSDPDLVVEWAQRTAAADLLIYGSGYPHWSSARPDQILPALDDQSRERILVDNAVDLYGPRLAAAPSQ